MRKVKPGQLWLDNKEIEMLYVVCSKEPNEPWLCMCFQDWVFGAFRRELYGYELNKLQYIGELKNARTKKR